MFTLDTGGPFQVVYPFAVNVEKSIVALNIREYLNNNAEFYFIFDYKQRNYVAKRIASAMLYPNLVLQQRRSFTVSLSLSSLMVAIRDGIDCFSGIAEYNYESNLTTIWSMQKFKQMAFSSDGALLACSTESDITIFDVENDVENKMPIPIKRIVLPNGMRFQELQFSPKNLNLGFTYDGGRKVGVLPLLDVRWIEENATLLFQLDFPPYLVLEILDWLLAFNESGVRWMHRLKIKIIYKAQTTLNKMMEQKENNKRVKLD